MSQRLKKASVAPVLQQGLPVEYLRGGGAHGNPETPVSCAVSLPHSSRIRLDVCPYSDLVSIAINIYVNGREWLARQMDKEKIQYVRQDDGETVLRPLAQRLNPLHGEIFGKFNASYYWTVPQCEWATGIVFEPGSLELLTPRFPEQGMLSFSQPGLMQFLGGKNRLDGSDTRGIRGRTDDRL